MNTKANASKDPLQELVSLCKRRGFIFQSSEIYGGLNSCWGYGPLGSQLKRKVKEGGGEKGVRAPGAGGTPPPPPGGGRGGRPPCRYGCQTLPRVRRRADRGPPVQPDVQDLH